jgi:peroxiredoxin
MAEYLTIDEKAPGFVLPNADGKPVSLVNLLRSGPVVLTWYRGSWCPYCHLQLRHLQNFLPNFWEAGAVLVALTPEPPDESLLSWKENWLQFEVLTDANNLVARKFGITRPVFEHVTDAIGEGHISELLIEKAVVELPLPAAYVLDTRSIVKYVFIDEDYRKQADPSKILEVLRGLKSNNI